MRGAMLFAAGLFAGLAMQVGTAQNTSGVVMIGFTQDGLQVEKAAQAVVRFRKSGVMVSDTSNSGTKAILANITDSYMGRIELTELPPESLHYKAIQNWK